MEELKEKINEEIKEKEEIAEKEGNDIVKHTGKFIIALVIPLILDLSLDYGVCNTTLFFTNTVSTLLSIFFMYMIYAILFALTKKSHRAVYIISILIFVLSIVSNVKLYYTQSPVYLSDIYFLGNASEITGLVEGDFIYHLDYMQIGILFAVLIFMCILARVTTITINKTRNRIIIGTIPVAILTIFALPISWKDNFILNNVYKVNERKDYAAMTRGIEYYGYYGVIAGMYGMELEGRNNKPENYNEELAKTSLNQFEYGVNENTDYGKPNIIIMFQESYWDIEQLEEIDFNIDVTQNIRELKEEGTSVNLLSASYGGMSSNIEFELLTGGNLAYFGVGYHPFIQLYNKKSSENNPSIVKELKNNGYKTKVVFGRDYYMSESVYKRLGMDEYINTFDDMPDYEEKVKGDYISDEALVNEVIEALYNKEDDERILYMTATIQSHMPFYRDKYDSYDMEIVKTDLTEEETDIIRAYAQGVYDTNVQIKRLYEEIKKLNEPTIIIMLGDHLPYLYNSEGEDILAKSSYFNTGNEKEDLLRLYTTEALILSNYGIEFNFDTEYISPDMLLTSIVNNMDIELSPYYKWLYKIKDILPAQNQYLTLDRYKNIYYQGEELTEEMQEAKKIRESIQYYLFEKN